MGVEKKIGRWLAAPVIVSLALAGVFRPLSAGQVANADHWAKIAGDTNADTNLRMEAARKLGEAKDPKYLEVLTDGLKDSNKAIRWTAAEALWDLGDKRALPALIEYLEKSEAYEWGKVITMNALASFKDPQAIDPLIKVLQSPNPFLRRSAAVALFTIGNDRAIPALIELLKDDEGFIQRIARNFLIDMTRDKMTSAPPLEYDAWIKWHQSNSHRLKVEGARQQ